MTDDGERPTERDRAHRDRPGVPARQTPPDVDRTCGLRGPDRGQPLGDRAPRARARPEGGPVRARAAGAHRRSRRHRGRARGRAGAADPGRRSAARARRSGPTCGRRCGTGWRSPTRSTSRAGRESRRGKRHELRVLGQGEGAAGESHHLHGRARLSTRGRGRGVPRPSPVALDGAARHRGVESQGACVGAVESLPLRLGVRCRGSPTSSTRRSARSWAGP